jgi:hypothetical protein
MSFKMKALLTHNSYNIRGGEDVVFDAETQLLKKFNFKVNEYVVDNRRMTLLSKIKLVFSTHYSKYIKQKISCELQASKTDVLHCHNLFPRLIPAIFDACKETKVSSVMTLHNDRTICPTALLMLNGKPCERT